MNPLTPLARDVRRDQLYRDALLAQPLDYFQVYFGKVPDQMERIQFVEGLVQVLAAPNVFVNDTYYIQMRDASPFVHLNIARCDGEPCTSWRDFQEIKNELVGTENEGVELFPAESRLVDTANQYHLWVMADSHYRFPFGYQRRLVFEHALVHPGVGTDGTAQTSLLADRPAPFLCDLNAANAGVSSAHG
jgi:hypothetical protein